MNTHETDAMIDRAANALRMIEVPVGPSVEVVEQVLHQRPSPAGDAARADRENDFGQRSASERAGRAHAARGSGRRVSWRVAFVFTAAMVLLAFGIVEMADRGERGGRGGAGMIFADVIAELKQVHTVTYRNVVTHPGAHGASVTYVERNIVDMAGSYSRTEMLDSPVKDALGEKPVETVRSISIYNRGKILNLDLQAKHATITDYNTDGLTHTLAGEHTLADLMKLNPLEAKPLGDRVFERVKLTGFRIHRDSGSFQRMTVDVWVDPHTRLPARIEETTVRHEADAKAIADMNAKGGVIHMTPEEADKAMATWAEVTTTSIITDIMFNVAVNEETFSVVPPPGYSLRVMTVPG